MELNKTVIASRPSKESHHSRQAYSGPNNTTNSVKLDFSQSGDSLTIRNSQFQIQYSTSNTRAQLLNAFGYLLAPSLRQAKQPDTGLPEKLHRQLIAIAKPHLMPLPNSITKLLKINGISPSQLAQLIGQQNGYRLGEGQLSGKQLVINNQAALMLQEPTLKPGRYDATIVNIKGELQLSLSPIIKKTEVILTPLSNSETKPLSTQSSTNTEEVRTRLESAALYRQLIKQLATSQPSTSTKDSNTLILNDKGIELANKLCQSLKKMTSSELASAYQGRTAKGSLANTVSSLEAHVAKANISPGNKPQPQISNSPIQEEQLPSQSAINPKTPSLASQLKRVSQSLASTLESLAAPNSKLSTQGQAQITNTQDTSAPSQALFSKLATKLPQFFPANLLELAKPELLKQELLTTSLLDINHPLPVTATSTQTNLSALANAGALTVIFQLLLGVKSTTNGTKLSQQLFKQLQKLQQRHQIESNLLSQLARTGTLEKTAQLAQSVQLYQQASSLDQQGINWYFNLPYQLNNKYEQFEGHFEKTETDDSDESGWRLQLKFNLTHGPMLIQAHKHQNGLNLIFKSESTYLLNQLEQHTAALSEKLRAVGLPTSEISTQKQKIAATLLPGDYYLVQAKA